jgi:transcriptional regulator with XRE-family HTH domain
MNTSQIECEHLPNQIRRYRLKRNLRLRDVADLTGQSCVAHISHWEKGRKSPSLKNCLRLSLAIQCPVEILFIEQFNQLKKEMYESKIKNNIEHEYHSEQKEEADCRN